MEKEFVLITGASGGIGKEICHALAKKGYHLYLHYNENKEAIIRLMEDLSDINRKGEFIPIQADLRTEEGTEKLCREVFQVDGIIHNSGNSVRKLLTNMQPEEINDLISLHLRAPIFITKSLLPKMIYRKKGSIIFISSIWGQTGASCETVYSAVKGGQISFAKALSKEIAPSNIRVNVVAPGAIQTRMISDLDGDELEHLKHEIPLGKFGLPEDIAKTVQFLLSEDASYITGQVIGVNGGWYT